jgi:hypothetical protein
MTGGPAENCPARALAVRARMDIVGALEHRRDRDRRVALPYGLLRLAPGVRRDSERRLGEVRPSSRSASRDRLPGGGRGPARRRLGQPIGP